MIRLLIRIGALYVAYKFGEEVGRSQRRVAPNAQRPRTPSESNEAFGEPMSGRPS